MARLRIRIELNRRMAGVPLDKMASVVEETRKFFYLLSEDVRMEADRGEWLASDFDAESLNFTAEYGGPVSAEQVQAFGAAFSELLRLLRRVTIAQFTRIADFLGEDELVGFGLYQSDQEPEPTEWRCLSKRDAMRFGEEIKLLAEAAGEAVARNAIARSNERKYRRTPSVQRPARGGVEAVAARSIPSGARIGIQSIAPHCVAGRRSGGADAEDATGPTDQWQSRRGGREVPEAFVGDGDVLGASAPPVRAICPRQFRWKSPVHVETPVARTPTTEQPRGWTVLGVTIAASAAILFGLAFPEMQRQWVRFATVEILPLVRPKPPEAPGLSVMSVQHKTTGQPVIQSVAARSPEPFAGPQIPLEVPANVKSKIQSEVQVDVLVAIDEQGKVTNAHVTSTKGDSAQLLVTEALRAARESRFRPAHEGARTVQSRMVLSFLFKPEANEF